MNLIDWTQIIVTVLTILTLLVLLWQTIIQNRLAKGQLLMLLNERYLKLGEAGRIDSALAQAKMFPEDLFNRDVYEKHYKNRPKAMRRYLYFAHVYEYINFAYMLEVDKVLPMYKAIKTWAKEISLEKEFQDVRDYYKGYYPQFSQYLERITLGKE